MYVKLNKPDTDYVLPHMWKFKKNQSEHRIVITRGWEG